MKRTLIAGLAGLVMLGVAAEAKVYKWVDENGKVVYSQSPPPEGTRAKEIKVDVSPPVSITKETPAQKAEKMDKRVQGNPALDTKLRKEYCEKGRKNLEVLESAKPDMGFVTEDNKLVKFSPGERALKIKETQAVIKAYCD